MVSSERAQRSSRLLVELRADWAFRRYRSSRMAVSCAGTGNSVD